MNVQSIPDYMKHSGCHRWLLWRSVKQTKGKPKKIPYYTNGKMRSGQLDSEADRASLATFDEALLVLENGQYTGLGFALGLDGNGNYWQGIDLDDLANNTGLSALKLPGYIETSPSGNGSHAIGYGRKFMPLGSNTSGIEAYCTGRFFTVTGECKPHLATANPIDLADFIEQVLKPIHGKKNKVLKKTSLTKAHEISKIPDEIINHLESALQTIPADNYHDWISIGQALYSLGDIGFKLWSKWSDASSKHQGEIDLKRWTTFNGERTGYASVFKKAAEYGWHNPKIKSGLSIKSDNAFESISKNTTSKFSLITVTDFLSRTPTQWIVKNILPKAELGMIFGASGSGKSFFALDLAASIARGIDWQGHKVKPGKVVYIASEAAAGLRNRIAAYIQHHNIDPETFQLTIIPASPNMLIADEISELSKNIEDASLIIIDTLACSTAGGDENSGKDMGQFIMNCKSLHSSTGALILLVHHSGKDAAKGARGWSGLRAAMDVEIEIIKKNGLRMAQVTKLKDGKEGAMHGFELKNVELGIDEDGDISCSCIINYIHSDTFKTNKIKLGKWEKHILQAFEETMKDGKAIADEIIEHVIKKIPLNSKRDQRRSCLNRAVKSLVDKNHFSLDGLHIIKGVTATYTTCSQ